MKRSLYSKILKAARAAHASGIKIVTKGYGLRRVKGGVCAAKKCGVCALAACAIGQEAVVDRFYGLRRTIIDEESTVRVALGLSVNEMSSFTNGFDGYGLAPGHDASFYAAGKRMFATLVREGIVQ